MLAYTIIITNPEKMSNKHSFLGLRGQKYTIYLSAQAILLLFQRSCPRSCNVQEAQLDVFTHSQARQTQSMVWYVLAENEKYDECARLGSSTPYISRALAMVSQCCTKPTKKPVCFILLYRNKQNHCCVRNVIKHFLWMFSLHLAVYFPLLVYKLY